MSDVEEFTDPAAPGVDVGERSAGDGRESSNGESPDITTDEDLDDEGSRARAEDGEAQQPSALVQQTATSTLAVGSEQHQTVHYGGKSNSAATSATNTSTASPNSLNPDTTVVSASSHIYQHLAQRGRPSGEAGLNGGGCLLPWGARKEAAFSAATNLAETNLRPGQYVMQMLFAEFTVTVERKIEMVMQEPLERSISKSLQRGEDPKFDQLVMGFGSVAEHCLPSLLRTLFDWYNRQGVVDWAAADTKPKPDPNKNKGVESCVGGLAERRDLAVEFVLCLVLIEVLKQLHVHPGHDELVHTIEDLAFKHFKHREGVQSNPNCANINVVADLYAEVIGVLAQSRFQSVRRRFMTELKELRSKEPSTHTTHNICALLMGMKFFRVKMVPIEEFEASFQFMQECAQYFLEVRDKDIKHALAGLFVEILVPVAAAVKNEVNVPCLKNFVEMLCSTTLDTATKNKHKLAIFPLLTCLLCVSQKQFFLSNWHYFLTMCLQHLKSRDPKMARVALESLYRLLWVYMIRIKCESNSATHSRLQSIVNSLFPKGSKTVVPRDTPLNIFVKIIQFIAQERLDFAMRDIVFDLLSVGRAIKGVISPERMAIGLRAFLVIADSLQQKEGDPPMPRTLAVLPSGNTLRVKKTFLSKMLTEDAARNIGLAVYYPLVRKAFNDILKALDTQFGKPLMMTNTHNVNKEPDDLIGGERKAKMDLLRTCVAAVPRLIPDGMSGQELVEMLARLTVHMDEELRALAFQSLQALVIDFPEWRHEVLYGFIQFVIRDVGDAFPQLLDSSLRMVLQLYTAWRTALTSVPAAVKTPPHMQQLLHLQLHQRGDDLEMVRLGEALSLVMLCACRAPPRRLAVLILKELKSLTQSMGAPTEHPALIDVMDRCCSSVVESVSTQAMLNERSSGAGNSGFAPVDLQWLAERTAPVWTGASSETDKSAGQQLPNDVWPQVLLGFLTPDRVLLQCPRVVAHTWPLIYTRAANLYPTVDPLQPNDNRASLLVRSATTLKKPVCERDLYLNLWRNYVVVACRVVPPMFATTAGGGGGGSSNASSATTASSTPLHQRCASPDISVGSSPDSGVGSGGSATTVSGGYVAPALLYKLLVPLLRCDLTEVRDVASLALGNINHHALGDVMEELVPNVRDSLDRKQENMRRRRRRDTLRLQLMKLFNAAAAAGTFALSDSVLDNDTGHLLKHYLDYLDGARAYLESDSDRDNALLIQIKVLFCKFVRQLIKSFTLEQQQVLIPRPIRLNLFTMFASWSGQFGALLGHKPVEVGLEDLDYSALQATVAVLCCGPAFDNKVLGDDSSLYRWLDALLVSDSPQVCSLAHEAIVLLLEANSDSGYLLDWLVEKCYTADPSVGDECFNDLAIIFSAREYPCDRYTAIMTVSLLYTACPRSHLQETALQLLQILDARFFGSSHHTVTGYPELGSVVCSTLDVFLTTTYSRSHMYLSKQLAQLHPELTMPIFSEISSRLQTARSSMRPLLFSCLLPWLYNMELVDPVLPAAQPAYAGQYYQESGLRREGWGSVEATEMVLNNLFYITARFGEDHPREVQELWTALCTCWPNNLRVIIRYLLIVTGMAPTHLLPVAQRVAISIGMERPDRLVEELMVEMGSVETLCLIERTETPPFYRVTAVRKCSGGQEDGVGGGKYGDGEESGEAGTLHTKRHSGDHQQHQYDGHTANAKEQRSAPGSLRSTSSIGSGVSSVIAAESAGANVATITPATAARTTISRPTSSLAPNSATTSNNMEDSTTEEAVEDNFAVLRKQQQLEVSQGMTEGYGGMAAIGGDEGIDQYEPPQPHPLPMPEYGGYYAPLTEYLPDSSQPIIAFHRCYLSVMLMCEVIVAGVDANCHSVDWSVHVPLMLHVIILGLDHSRPIVHHHCKRLLVHILTVVGDHRDHLGIARVMLNRKTCARGYKLIPHNTFQHSKLFTEEPPKTHSESSTKYVSGASSDGPLDTVAQSSAPSKVSTQTSVETVTEAPNDMEMSDEDDPVHHPSTVAAPTASTATAYDSNRLRTPPPPLIDELQFNIKALLDFLANSEGQPLWSYEDITPKQLTIKSAEQLANFVRHVVGILSESLPHSHLEERLAQIALHLALSCSSRHYAGRSLQVLRCLHVSLSSRMLSELLGRLVETVAEQGEDMQGYVTELMLTLEAAVDALHSDFRPIEFVRELFKSTPNLNKDRKGGVLGSVNLYSGALHHRIPHPPPSYPLKPPGSPGHLRSTSFSISYARGKHISSPTADIRVGEMRGRSGTDADTRYRQQQQQQLFAGGSLSRSRSAQSLKLLADQTNDDKLAVLSQLFWIAVSMLESDYEYEFLLASRLLDKVLSRLPLNRPDALDKLEKLQHQLKWRCFPGVHALLLKGCTSASLYESAVALLSRLTCYTHLQVIDPSPSRNGFAMNVMALLPYMLHHYEDANALCIQAAENIAQISQECSDEGKQLQNLATVMTLYSRRNFSKESFQWTKCVVKYLHDSYSTQASALLSFLVEMLEKGPLWVQCPVLNIIYCMLHYTDLNGPPHNATVNADVLSVISRYMEGNQWKEALRILKLAVTGSSSLVLPPSSLRSGLPTAASPTRSDGMDCVTLLNTKKELPGRTMEFTFNVDQTPIIGRRYLTSQGSVSAGGSLTHSTVSSSLTEAGSAVAGSVAVNLSVGTTTSLDSRSTPLSVPDGVNASISGMTALTSGLSHASPRRSSFSPYDVANSQGGTGGAVNSAVPWKKPWQSQARVRERLVNLLNTCGQRVGLPKSPSEQDGNINKVIFSQSSELERQSSMASSTEEVSAGAGNAEDRTPGDDITSSENQFAVFKDFDFLEYELESQGEESVDNFNLWGVRRRSPTNSTTGAGAPPAVVSSPSTSAVVTTQASTSDSVTQQQQQKRAEQQLQRSPPSPPPEPDWWDEDGSVSPLDDTTSHTTSETGGHTTGDHTTADTTTTQVGSQLQTSSQQQEVIQTPSGGAVTEGGGRRARRKRRREATEVAPAEDVEYDEEEEELCSSPGRAARVSTPPNKLSLGTREPRRASSRSSLSDESSEGELNDLTPCNAPPNMLLFPSTTTLRPPVQPLHTSWRAHLSALTQQLAGLNAPAYSCALFSAMFSECVSKSCSAVREAAPLLSGLGSNTAALVSHLEAVACVSPLPYVYLDSTLLDVCGLQSKVKASFIALHEHTDTFLDKLDTALMMMDTMRGSVMKATSDSEESTVSRGGHLVLSGGGGGSEEHQIELCRALYRLHFQVSLMYDTYAKTLLLLLHSARHTSQVKDHSVELSALRGGLVAAAEQLDATPPQSPRLPRTPLSPPLHHRYQSRDMPEGEECETDSVGETEVYSLEEDVLGGESSSSVLSSSYHGAAAVAPGSEPLMAGGGGGVSTSSSCQALVTPTHSSSLPALTTPTHSTASTLPPTVPSLPQANHKVLQLVADQKWKEVVQYSNENSCVWLQPGMPYHNITTILNIYCTYLAEKQPGMVAICCTESFLTETSQHLADANFAALGALRLMETEQQQQLALSIAPHSTAAAPILTASHPTLYSTSATLVHSHSSYSTQPSMYSTVATAASTTYLEQQGALSPTSSHHSSTLHSATFFNPSSLSVSHPHCGASEGCVAVSSSYVRSPQTSLSTAHDNLFTSDEHSTASAHHSSQSPSLQSSVSHQPPLSLKLSSQQQPSLQTSPSKQSSSPHSVVEHSFSLQSSQHSLSAGFLQSPQHHGGSLPISPRSPKRSLSVGAGGPLSPLSPMHSYAGHPHSPQHIFSTQPYRAVSPGGAPSTGAHSERRSSLKSASEHQQGTSQEATSPVHLPRRSTQC